MVALASSVEMRRLLYLLRHIENVQRSCQVMALKIIERGEFELGKELLKQGMTHDISKFDGIEFEELNGPDIDTDSEAFREAMTRHVSNNTHHPQYFDSEPGANDGIHHMGPVFLYEMVADWSARSSEQGTDLREVIRTRAMPRFGFCEADPVFRVIEDAIGLLLEPKFT